MLQFEGGKYEVTDVDRLWLLRAVEAEGPPSPRVAEALVNGFCYQRAAGLWKRSLMDYVRAYAQPINPRWYIAGDLYKQSLAKKTNADEKLEAQRAAYRRESVHSKRTTFSPTTVAAVSAALSKRITHDVTDYAAAYVDASYKGYVARSPVKKGENRFWTRAAGWTGYAASEVAAGGTGLVLALLAFVWLLKRGA